MLVVGIKEDLVCRVLADARGVERLRLIASARLTD
jgi:hypothetical protein